MANALGKRRSSGFSMIEVLVTLVLISIGVLGMVALQARTIQYTQDAVQRNTAAMLANDLVELIRAMPDGLTSSGFYNAAGTVFPEPPATGCAPLPANAAGQLGCWAEKAKAALPGASNLLTSEFYICRTATANTCSGAGNAIEIQLAWRVKEGDCENSGDDKTICYYRLRTQI
jgi:type IV pilus assembly protein PilV